MEEVQVFGFCWYYESKTLWYQWIHSASAIFKFSCGDKWFFVLIVCFIPLYRVFCRLSLHRSLQYIDTYNKYSYEKAQVCMETSYMNMCKYIIYTLHANIYVTRRRRHCCSMQPFLSTFVPTYTSIPYTCKYASICQVTLYWCIFTRIRYRCVYQETLYTDMHVTRRRCHCFFCPALSINICA